MVSWMNKFIILAILLVLANQASDGFIFQQLDKADIDGTAMAYEDELKCAAGILIIHPVIDGIPIPAFDDVMVVLVGYLLILGSFSALNRPLRNRYKLLVLVVVWVSYKLLGYYLITTTSGCADQMAVIEAAVSPLSPIFMFLAVIVIYKVYSSRRGA